MQGIDPTRVLRACTYSLSPCCSAIHRLFVGCRSKPGLFSLSLYLSTWDSTWTLFGTSMSLWEQRVAGGVIAPAMYGLSFPRAYAPWSVGCRAPKHG